MSRIRVYETTLRCVEIRLFQLNLSHHAAIQFRNGPPTRKHEITHVPIGQPFDYFCALLERKVRIWTLWARTLSASPITNPNAKNTPYRA